MEDSKKDWREALTKQNHIAFFHQAELQARYGHLMPKPEITKEQQELLDLRDNLKAQLLPCPFCGGTKLSTSYNEVRGHGDSGFSNFGVSCKCGAHKGRLSDYGSPTIHDEIKAYEIWNERK